MQLSERMTLSFDKRKHDFLMQNSCSITFFYLFVSVLYKQM